MVVECDRALKYVAGQYATFKLPGMARGRNYSFADAPQQIGNKTLVFFVRKVPGGEFTEALFGGRVNGQALTIEGPRGAFRLHPGNTEMVCIAGGSGLAPLISVLEDMRECRERRPCTLLFGARTQADLYALDTIATLASAWTEHFEFLPVLSHEPAGSDWNGARGWVTDFISRPGTSTAWADAEGYLCGPPPMIDSGIARLLDLGVPLQHIHYDKFTDGEAPPAPAARQQQAA
jgi:p-cymene monooxygenase electron transfer component